MILEIAIVEKSPVTRLGFEQFFKERFGNISLKSVQTVADLDLLYVGSAPHLIVLGFARVSITECLKVLNVCKQSYIASSIVLFGDFYNSQSVVKILAGGAAAYVSKQTDPAEMEQRVKNILAESINLVDSLKQSFTTQSGEQVSVRKDKKRLRIKALLSWRENQIAELLCQGLGTCDIAKLLNLKCSTVSSMKRKIFTKLQVTNLIELCFRFGSFPTEN